MPAEKSLKDKASENPTQIGDPVSLKAETSNTKPTDQDLGAKADKHDGKKKKNKKKTLKEKAGESLKQNPTALGDPVSLKAETSETEPTDQDRGARDTSKSKSKGSGKPKM